MNSFQICYKICLSFTYFLGLLFHFFSPFTMSTRNDEGNVDLVAIDSYFSTIFSVKMHILY
jgi:hypothetical protein